MITAIISIIILTCVVWIGTKLLKFKICPICAGVSLTWIWMILVMYLGKLPISDYELPVAILAGGTVVGLMYKLEKYIKTEFILTWKTIFTVSGFTTVYSLVTGDWKALFISIIVQIAVTLMFKTYIGTKGNSDLKNLKELEEKMKNCC